MKRLFASLLFAATAVFSQTAKPLPPVHRPDLATWRLELTPDLGGWVTEGALDLRIKLVDPKDPDPPKEEAVVFDDYYYDGEEEPDERTAEQMRQDRLWEEEASKRNAWRNRTLHLWVNGVATQLSAQVGRTVYHSVASQSGENRLEIWEPDSGKRLVRTWWASAARTRLTIAQVRSEEDSWSSGSLQIMEPNGDLASRGRRTTSGGTLTWSNEYRHATPPMGTYTIRWTGGYRGGRPVRVTVEAILDGGTDRERRWRFERVMLPGAGPATLGTLDVEN